MFQKTNGLSYYQYPHLCRFDELVHGVFTRKAGYSRDPFHSLNVGLATGDDARHVHRNRRAVIECMGGLSPVFLKQVHGDIVVNLDKIGRDNLDHDNTCVPAESLKRNPGGYLEGDAMVTSLPGIMPVIQVADCQPVFLFDPQKKVAANIHSGWRGSIKNIIAKTITCMSADFNSMPSDIVAGIGPSLGPCCAEFKNYRKEIPREYWKYEIGDRYFDFWTISRDQLISAGVLEKHICISNICTRCTGELFYSYRKERVTGRFAAVIGIKQPQNEKK